MTDNPYRVPLEQAQVLRADQVVLRGDGVAPPPAGLCGLHADGGPLRKSATEAACRRGRRGAHR